MEGLERLDADEGALGQLLAPAEGPLLVGELDEVRGLDEPDVPRLERRPDALRLGVAVEQLGGSDKDAAKKGSSGKAKGKSSKATIERARSKSV